LRGRREIEREDQFLGERLMPISSAKREERNWGDEQEREGGSGEMSPFFFLFLYPGLLFLSH